MLSTRNLLVFLVSFQLVAHRGICYVSCHFHPKIISTLICKLSSSVKPIFKCNKSIASGFSHLSNSMLQYLIISASLFLYVGKGKRFYKNGQIHYMYIVHTYAHTMYIVHMHILSSCVKD